MTMAKATRSMLKQTLLASTAMASLGPTVLHGWNPPKRTVRRR